MFPTPQRPTARIPVSAITRLKDIKALSASLGKAYAMGANKGEDHDLLREAAFHHLATVVVTVNAAAEALKKNNLRTTAAYTTISKINCVVVEKFSDIGEQSSFELMEYLRDLNMVHSEIAMAVGGMQVSELQLSLLDCRLHHTSDGNVQMEIKPDLLPFEIVENQPIYGSFPFAANHSGFQQSMHQQGTYRNRR